jgi:copper chaperone CopZ
MARAALRAYVGQRTMPTTQIKIAKFSDATDAAHLEKALEAVPRVQSVRIDPEIHAAFVEHEGADPKELTEAVKRLGYAAAVE